MEVPAQIRASKEKAVIKNYKMDLLFILEHPDYELSASLLSWYAQNRKMLIYRITDERIIQLYNRLSSKWRNSHYGKAILTALKNENSPIGLKAGMKAPDIEMKDITGEMTSLASLRGRYVLLDFWSSGCGPCRNEHKNYARLHKRYHHSGFEIFSVSLEKIMKNGGMLP